MRGNDVTGGTAIRAALRIALAATFAAFAWLILGAATSAFAADEPQQQSVLSTVAPVVTNLGPALQLVAQPQSRPQSEPQLAPAVPAHSIPAVMKRILAKVPVVNHALAPAVILQPVVAVLSEPLAEIIPAAQSGIASAFGAGSTTMSAVPPSAITPTALLLRAGSVSPPGVPAPPQGPAGEVTGSNSSGSPGSASSAFATADSSGFTAPRCVASSARALNDALPASFVLDPGSSPD